MTAFSRIDVESQFFLVALLFLAALCELALCLYQQVCRSGRGHRITDGVLFLIALALCAHTMTAARYREYRAALPWAAVPLAAALLIIRAVAGMRREYRESRETLSPSSVKQALDNLNSGILFADETGKTVLVNRTMGMLAGMLTGSYPQMSSELESALQAPDRNRGVEKISDSPALFRFPDGRIWRFQTMPLDEPELAGFTQTSAQDMTELYETNAQLERDNAALRVAIARLIDMKKRLTNMVPKQEALNLKIRIHDEIGASLIALSKLAVEGNQADTDAQLKILEHALIPFGSERAAIPGTFEAAQRQASEMNVSLMFDGFVPPNEDMERLISTAALECVTNCVHHAKGGSVAVKISERKSIYTVIITNDGEPPKAPIVEGGGLSALRRNVENAGGEMHLSHAPRFTLILNLPEKRPEA